MANKRTFIRRAYKAIQPLTSGIYRDDSWQGVKKVVKAIIDSDKDVTLHLESAEYKGTMGECGHRKVYDYTITGCDKNVTMRIIASFCGTLADPMGAYDITVLMN